MSLSRLHAKYQCIVCISFFLNFTNHNADENYVCLLLRVSMSVDVRLIGHVFLKEDFSREDLNRQHRTETKFQKTQHEKGFNSNFPPSFDG